MSMPQGHRLSAEQSIVQKRALLQRQQPMATNQSWPSSYSPRMPPGPFNGPPNGPPPTSHEQQPSSNPTLVQVQQVSGHAQAPMYAVPATTALASYPPNSDSSSSPSMTPGNGVGVVWDRNGHPIHANGGVVPVVYPSTPTAQPLFEKVWDMTGKHLEQHFANVDASYRAHIRKKQEDLDKWKAGAQGWCDLARQKELETAHVRDKLNCVNEQLRRHLSWAEAGALRAKKLEDENTKTKENLEKVSEEKRELMKELDRRKDADATQLSKVQEQLQLRASIDTNLHAENLRLQRELEDARTTLFKMERILRETLSEAECNNISASSGGETPAPPTPPTVAVSSLGTSMGDSGLVKVHEDVIRQLETNIDVTESLKTFQGTIL